MLRSKPKGTVSVISSDPPSKAGNACFTKMPFKPLADQYCGRYCRFSSLKNVKIG